MNSRDRYFVFKSLRARATKKKKKPIDDYRCSIDKVTKKPEKNNHSFF